VKLPLAVFTQLRKLRQVDKDNINKFLGLCVDGPVLMSVWKYCPRGSLQDVIASDVSYAADPFVMFTLMKDIVNVRGLEGFTIASSRLSWSLQGLGAIHQTFGPHGNLTSQCCLINDRWQLKIAEHGLGLINDQQPIRRRSTSVGLLSVGLESR